jgi:integrase/recombinase XerD
MSYSCKIYFRRDYVKKDGNCAIYLQVIINRIKKAFPLDLFWPPEYCSDGQDLCLSRTRSDDDTDDMNMMLRDKLSRANDIFKYYRLSGQNLTMDRFIDKWKNGDVSHDNFLEYFENYALMMFKEKKYGLRSYKHFNTTLLMLAKMSKGNMSFSDLDEKWGHKFDSFLAKNIKARGTDTQNTRWGYHKDIKTVLNYARDFDQIIYINPYKYFSISNKRGNWKALKIDEVVSLFDHYKSEATRTERVVLRRFLFGCATSLRISDLRRVRSDWRENDAILFRPEKNKKKITKEIKIPLSNMALYFWNDALMEKGEGLLFNDFEEQYANRILKKIALKLEIKTNLHHHVSRHTWTTLFLNNGGTLRAAQKTLGHSTVKTTEIYDHMGYSELVKEKSKMEFISLVGKSLTDE